MRTPTYTAEQVREMCASLPLEHDVFKVLVELIDEEIDLYQEQDLIMLTQASLVLFNRSMMAGALKFMK